MFITDIRGDWWNTDHIVFVYIDGRYVIAKTSIDKSATLREDDDPENLKEWLEDFMTMIAIETRSSPIDSLLFDKELARRRARNKREA